MIDQKDKNVNALQKTKIDWDKHTKDNKLEAEFEKNRKDGYLVKKAFLDQAIETEYQHQKQIEKHQIKVKNEQLGLSKNQWRQRKIIVCGR